MKELNKALDIAWKGPAADAAVAAFRKQMAKWKLAPPPATPLVLDFGLGDFAHVGLIETWIANETRAGYCGKYMFVFDGQQCPLHRHRTKHETFFILKGRVRMRIKGRPKVLGEGEVLPVAPGTEHSFEGVGPALLLELSMPCVVGDNYFTNRDIPIGGNYRPFSARGGNPFPPRRGPAGVRNAAGRDSRRTGAGGNYRGGKRK